MPLLFVKDVAPNVKLGVWSIKENVDEFFFRDKPFKVVSTPLRGVGGAFAA